MRLNELLRFTDIVIQCHNVPDADALASGFALYRFLVTKGKKPRLLYGGRETISKPNIRHMVELLEIPVEYALEIEKPELLVTVDCQYGEGNVWKFDAETIAVIDHHEVEDRSGLPALHEVKESYGACATVLYEMLKEAGYDLASDSRLQTALYYGLYMDTSRFQELWHPADKDLWDALEPDEAILDVLKNSNLSTDDLQAIGNAFFNHEMNREYRYVTSEVKTGDPNILGVVSDTMVETDGVDTCVAYAYLENGVKPSVRSCASQIRADELSKVLTEGIGNAGGHIRKAGGFANRERLTWGALDWQTNWKSLLQERMKSYVRETLVIRAGDPLDLSGFSLFRKIPLVLGVVEMDTLYPTGTEVKIRTYEGDIDVRVDEDTFLMIGVAEEIYPIQALAFYKNYQLTDRNYVFRGEYIPSIRDYQSGGSISLKGYARECITRESTSIYAKRLMSRAHVFSRWDPQKYFYGKPGDWLAARVDDPGDIYIIRGEIFARTYQAVETGV